MFKKLLKSSDSTLIEKCNRELEVKYTKMLTMEFCVSWVNGHFTSSGQCAALVFQNKAKGENINEFRLDVLEQASLTGDAKSLCCCLIFALEIEPALKKVLAEGNGAYVFVR